MCPQSERREAWRRLGQDLDPAVLDGLCKTLPLAECIPAAERLLAGQVRGRVIVPLDGAE
jgi:acrylyl-CoA reductase (NADPH)